MKILEIIKTIILAGLLGAFGIFIYFYQQNIRLNAIDGCAQQSRYTVETTQTEKKITATEYQKWHFDLCLKLKGI